MFTYIHPGWRDLGSFIDWVRTIIVKKNFLTPRLRLNGRDIYKYHLFTLKPFFFIPKILFLQSRFDCHTVIQTVVIAYYYQF
uniref:Uncharacterized protein n=1 Tax=Anguilla anguilla TaxID=7936 RepID=A0A0E9QK71_ANGAN